ncbi:MAG TPA: aspartate kinase [Bacteroidales bacterium]|nr:aspartate kinase [Bacteroidales bacterium]HPI84896.1 aspartate kinase [Bacteroidales bacterium]
MKVFKFGGGVMNSAGAVGRIPEIIRRYPGIPLVIVVSAFGKTTNALEELIASTISADGRSGRLFRQIKEYHDEITRQLFPNDSKEPEIRTGAQWNELERITGSEVTGTAAEIYDRMIVFGELISSVIVSEYLNRQGIENTWCDIRTVVRTDSVFRDASIDWEVSEKQSDAILKPLLKSVGGIRPVVVTQGFIGSDDLGRSTSLGREGSDYTASVLASLLDASEVITWKDVPGILNADPRHFSQTIKLERISYSEATELAYYGAKVLHPKTIKPLQNKNIPLQVRSFEEPDQPGTLIQEETGVESLVPSFIFKFGQVLMSVSAKDFSFIDEKVFRDVFSLLSKYAIHVNIIQNSALSLSFCTDSHGHLVELIDGLRDDYIVKYNEGLELITIRHSNDRASEIVLSGREVLLEQHNRVVSQYVVR